MIRKTVELNCASLYINAISGINAILTILFCVFFFIFYTCRFYACRIYDFVSLCNFYSKSDQEYLVGTFRFKNRHK